MNEAPLGEAGRNVDNISFRPADTYDPCKAEDQTPQHDSVRPASGTLIRPSPHGGVYRSKSPGTNVPPAAELWNLLHLDKAKAVAQSNGCYKGHRLPITREDLERHLAGEVTLAFTVLRGSRALFAVLDVDALFRELLNVIRAAVLAIGGEELLDAIFCTSGSSDGRGKVVVTFTQLVPARSARKLIRRLYKRARASEAAQHLQGDELSAYPQEKSGGLARILGRNVARGGSVEKSFSLCGEAGLSFVRPLAPAKLAAIAAGSGERIAAWAERRIETPWLRREGTNTHYRWMVALAREAIRVCGRLRGSSAYDGWLDRIKANSPELSLRSLKTNDLRNVLDHGRQRAWEYACKNPNSWEPSHLQIRKGVPRGVVRVYNALASFVREKGLRPSSFGIDYERIAVLIGSSKSTAYRLVKRAGEFGVLVIHDRGRSHTKGAPGQCTRLGLICRGQTSEQVRGARVGRETPPRIT
jgi:hypothetical protein